MWPLINFGLSVALLTLILVIQVVHYPSFHFYGEREFVQGMVAHQQRISFIVIPLMLAEVVAAAAMVALQPTLWPLANALLVVGIWLVTFTTQVPLHKKLLVGKDPSALDKLIKGNWGRVALWSFKTVVATKLL